MAANLTYHVRAGQLTAVAAGRVFEVPTQADPARVTIWEKTQELRSGTHTLWDKCFAPSQRLATGLAPVTRRPAGQTVIYRVSLSAANPVVVPVELFDYPGRYAQRFDGVDDRPTPPHGQAGSVIYVGDRQAGLYVHGGPACRSSCCVVVLRQWDDLLRAVASEPELSFAIAM
jgi:hypothetical protein